MRFFVVIKAKDSDRGSQLITLAQCAGPLISIAKKIIFWISSLYIHPVQTPPAELILCGG